MWGGGLRVCVDEEKMEKSPDQRDTNDSIKAGGIKMERERVREANHYSLQ